MVLSLNKGSILQEGLQEGHPGLWEQSLRETAGRVPLWVPGFGNSLTWLACSAKAQERGDTCGLQFSRGQSTESPAAQPGLTRRPRVAWLPQHTPGTTTSTEAGKTCKCALTFSLGLSGTLHPSQRRATHLPLQDVHLTEISNSAPALERPTGAQLHGQLLQPKPTQAQGARRAGWGMPQAEGPLSPSRAGGWCLARKGPCLHPLGRLPASS